jgi:FtsH-binding integral membrane protein
MDAYRRNRRIGIASVMFPLLATLLAGIMASSFAPMHRHLQPLPMISRIFLDSWPGWVLLAVPLLVLWWLQSAGALGERRVLATGAALGFGLFAFSVIACYAPIFRLAASA